MSPATIEVLDVADATDCWRDLGFSVDSDGAEACCTVGGVPHRLGASGQGVSAWRLTDVDEAVAGLPVAAPLASGDHWHAGAHPNGVIALDHLVVSTPDLGRTIDDLEAAGIELRRTRDAGGRMVQAFFKLGGVVLEVVGSPDKSGAGSPRFWGLAFTVDDLDATAAFLGDRLHPPKDAVQPGRRIATLDKSAGSSVPIAFMSADAARATPA